MSPKIKDIIPADSLRAFVKALPKVELHCHLEGAIWPEALLELKEKYKLPLPSESLTELRAAIQVGPSDKTLLDFLKKFEVIGRLFVSEEVIEQITESVVRDAAADGVRILEIRFAPCYMAEAAGLDPMRVAEAVLRAGRRAAEKVGVEIKFILIAVRNSSPPDAEKVLEIASRLGVGSISGFDLAGDEGNFPPGLFADVFRRAAQIGLRITVHAGEAAGADSVRGALSFLGAERIGHGVRANEDRHLLEQLRESRIPLEMCLTSNRQTGAVQPGKRHPFKEYLAAGLKVTLNTDDPAVSGVRLSDEFYSAIMEYDLTVEELKHLLNSAIEASFADNRAKARVSAETKDFLLSYGLYATRI